MSFEKYEVAAAPSFKVSGPTYEFFAPANGCGVPHKRQDEADCIHFVYKRLTGDGAITAKLNALTNFHKWGGAGVMIRTSLEDTGLNLSSHVIAEDGVLKAAVHLRQTVAPTGYAVKTSEPLALPIWFRVERKGDELIGSYSVDGTTFNELSRIQLSLGAELLAGFAVWNRYIDGQASFTDASVTTAP
jgi:hypothetical protein